MATVRISTTIRFTDADGTERAPLEYDKTLTVDGNYVDLGVASLAVSTAKSLLDLTDSSFNITDFDALVLVFESGEEGKVMAELVTDKGGTPRYNSLPLAMDVPLVLGADDSYNGTSGSFAGSLTTIKEILVKNTSASTVARVRIFAVT